MPHLTLADALAPKKLGTLIYYGRSGDVARTLRDELRANKEIATLRDGHVFSGEPEPCNSVVVMPDVHESARARIAAVYGDKVRSFAQAIPEESAVARSADPPPLTATDETVVCMPSPPLPRRRGRPPKADLLAKSTDPTTNS